MVWARDLDGTKKPEDDVIRFYYIGPYVRVRYDIADYLPNDCTGE